MRAGQVGECGCVVTPRGGWAARRRRRGSEDGDDCSSAQQGSGWARRQRRPGCPRPAQPAAAAAATPCRTAHWSPSVVRGPPCPRQAQAAASPNRAGQRNCCAHRCVGLVSSPSRMSLRQMSQASTLAEGSTTMAFSRPRPRTCGATRRGGARALSSPSPAGPQAHHGWRRRHAPRPAQHPSACRALPCPARMHAPRPPRRPHLLDERRAEALDFPAEDGAQAGRVLRAPLLHQHLRGGRAGGGGASR